MYRYNKMAIFSLVFVMFLALSALSLVQAQSENDVKDPNPPVGASSVSTNAVGGPDGFGYRFIDNNEIDGPEYNFIDISGTGTALGLIGDDAGTALINIGFPFNFYGADFTQVAMSTNGYMNFNPAGDLTDFGNDCPGLNAFDPDNSIYVYWDDLVMGASSDAYVQTFAECPNPSGGSEECTVFMWDNAEHWPSSDGFNFQVILYDNGNILKQFPPGNPENGFGSTTGIENAVPDIGLDYACNTSSSITENLAVCYIHPDSTKQNCSPGIKIVDVNQEACILTKSNPNAFTIAGATPDKKVAVVMGLKTGMLTVNGPTCNGLELGVRQARLFAVERADEQGVVMFQAPVPPLGDQVTEGFFQVVDLDTCTAGEVERYDILIDDIQTNDKDGDGVVNCKDACPDQGLPNPNPIFNETLGADGCIESPCDDTDREVSYDGSCYYLDGSGGVCLDGYELAPQSVLNTIALGFVGKDYKTMTSSNCCIWHADQGIEGQDWGMTDSAMDPNGNGECSKPGPIEFGPILGGANCTDALNLTEKQLTLCVSENDDMD